MRPKVILQLYPMLPAAGEGGRQRQRPIGRDSDLYHRVVHEWLDIIKAADDMGVWGASTIEHHLHSEGYEVGPNPLGDGETGGNVACYFYDPDYHNVEFCGAMDTIENYRARYGATKGSARA